MTQDPEQNDIFHLQSIRELVQMLAHTEVTELTIEHLGSTIHIKRNVATPTQTGGVSDVQPVLSASSLAPLGASHTPHPPADPHATSQTLDVPEGWVTIVAPMVGTLYTSPSPRDEPYVREGDEVTAGDTVCIIEAMKIMNEVECEVTGRVATVLVKNGQPVEYGQPVMIIEPT